MMNLARSLGRTWCARSCLTTCGVWMQGQIQGGGGWGSGPPFFINIVKKNEGNPGLDPPFFIGIVINYKDE